MIYVNNKKKNRIKKFFIKKISRYFLSRAQVLLEYYAQRICEFMCERLHIVLNFLQKIFGIQKAQKYFHHQFAPKSSLWVWSSSAQLNSSFDQKNNL